MNNNINNGLKIANIICMAIGAVATLAGGLVSTKMTENQNNENFKEWKNETALNENNGES